MIFKIKMIDPKSYKKSTTIKCRDCLMSYTFAEYGTLNTHKKLCYFKLPGDDVNFYCHDCCTKRVLFIKTHMKDMVVVIANGSVEKSVDLD